MTTAGIKDMLLRHSRNGGDYIADYSYDFVVKDISEMLDRKDKEWTQKIQTALDKTSNWNCKEVLTKLLEDKLWK